MAISRSHQGDYRLRFPFDVSGCATFASSYNAVLFASAVPLAGSPNELFVSQRASNAARSDADVSVGVMC